MLLPRLNRRYIFIWLAGLVLLAGGCAWLGVQWALIHTRAFTQEVNQAIHVLETAPDPAGAVAQAQQHLAAARAELETLRPAAELARQASGLADLPLLGQPVREGLALWTFADHATRLGEELLNAAELGLGPLKEGDIAGLAAALPAIQTQLQAAQVSFNQAQAGRVQIGAVSWLPGDLGLKLNIALERWDAVVLPLGETLTAANRLIDQVDVEQAWLHTQALTRALDQTTRRLEGINNDPLAALAQVQPHLAAARAELDALQPVVEPVIAQADKLTQLSKVELPVEQIFAWWQFANATVRLGDELSGAAQSELHSMETKGLPGLVATLPALQSPLRSAQANFSQAQFFRTRLNEVTWLPADLAKPLNTSLAQWDKFAPFLEVWLPQTNHLVEVLPRLAGRERPVTYLLLLQSSDELRATGGFIGGLGAVRLEDGKITAVKIGEVTEFDNQPLLREGELVTWLQPPDPFVRYMGLGHWFLRDANWWADFPASARRTVDLWGLANNTPVDGVIALTDRGVTDLLLAVGPLETLDRQTVTAENAKSFAAGRIYLSEPNANQAQSKLLWEMTLVFLALTQDLTPERSFQFSRQLQEEMSRRDLLMAGFDPAIAATLHELGVDGALRGQEDDYFYLVESNLSYNKLSPFIRQNLTYEVELNPTGQAALATLTVDEVNTYQPGAGLAEYPAGYYDGGRWNPDTRHVDRWAGYYGGYTRLYPAVDSQFLTATGFDDGPEIVTENGRSVVGGYLGLFPGDQQQLRFKWIPGSQPAVPGQYRLLVQRQPGSPEHALTVRVNLPPGYRAGQVTPTPIITTETSVTWHALLNRDQTFSLMLEKTWGIATDMQIEATPPDAGPVAAITPRPPSPVAPAPPPEPGRAPLPAWLVIPAIGVSAPVVPVGLEPGGIMASPAEAGLIGWYELGPRPGEPSNAVLAGHINWMGKTGAFVRLHELKPGDTIEIQSGPDRGYHFVVESLETYQADTAPVADIFGPTPGPVLTLITCGGPYDTSRQVYRDRLVVRARGLD